MGAHTRVHYGSSIDQGNDYSEETAPEDWCEFSAKCYKKRTERHWCDPIQGKGYWDGCPKDSVECDIAIILRRMYRRKP